MELQFNLNNFVVEDALRAVSIGVFGNLQKSYKENMIEDNPMKFYPNITDGSILEGVPSDDPSSQYVLQQMMQNKYIGEDNVLVPGPIIVDVNIGPESYAE